MTGNVLARVRYFVIRGLAVLAVIMTYAVSGGDPSCQLGRCIQSGIGGHDRDRSGSVVASSSSQVCCASPEAPSPLVMAGLE